MGWGIPLGTQRELETYLLPKKLETGKEADQFFLQWPAPLHYNIHALL